MDSDRLIKMQRAVAALHGSDRQLRFEAVLELADLEDQRAIVPLRDRLWVELAMPNIDLAMMDTIARVALLRRLRYSGIVPDLVAVVEVGEWIRWSLDTSDLPARRALNLLVRLGPAGVAAVIALLEHSPHAVLRHHAASLLRGKGRAVPALIATVENGAEDDRVRAVAAASLGYTHAREAIPALLHLVLNPSDRPRWGGTTLAGAMIAATTALGRIGDERAITALVGLICQVDENQPATELLALAAIEALSSIHSVQTVPLLIETLDTDVPLVRYYVARALGATRDERAVTPLKHLLDDTTLVPSSGQIVAFGARRGLRRLRRYLRRHAEAKM